MSKIVVSGVAGFIGSRITKQLLVEGHQVVGIDSFDHYYDLNLKLRRLEFLKREPLFYFELLDLVNRPAIKEVFSRVNPQIVVHAAAQPGVRNCTQDPDAYIDNNLIAVANVLEGCRQTAVDHFIFASSSSVYGHSAVSTCNGLGPDCDHPASLYAATKRAGELLAYSYSSMFGLNVTGLRYFTVYGPWGRPDMALYKFTDAIFAGRPIELFGYGELKRDFTYIDDVVEATVRIIKNPPPHASGRAHPNTAQAEVPFQVFDVGRGQPVAVPRIVEILEQCLGRKANIRLAPEQLGDVTATQADPEPLFRATGFRPEIPVDVGIPRFVDWYCSYHGVERSIVPARIEPPDPTVRTC